MMIRKNSSATFTTISLLLISTVVVLGYDDYYAEYYDEDSQPPVFTSKSQLFTVELGESAIIPCDAKNPGDYKLVIKRAFANGGEQLLWVGREKMARTKRLHLDAQALRLTISNIRVTDAGTYVCHFGTNPPMELQHHVDVHYPPVVSLSVSPEQRVRVGTTVTLTCAARGNPEPIINWSKREDSSEHLIQLQQPQQQLILPEVSHESTGTYICSARNGIGHPSSASATLIVEYPPKVITEEHSVRSGEGESLELVCLVSGEPKPSVVWAHDGDVILPGLDTEGFKGFHKSSKYYLNSTKYDHINMGSPSNSENVPLLRSIEPGIKVKPSSVTFVNNTFMYEHHSLTIENIHEADFGTYVCKAENNFGKDYVTIQVTGLPHPPQIVSEPESNKYNSYTFKWEAESYYPIMEHMLKYKPRQLNNSTLSNESWERITKVTDPQSSSSLLIMSDQGYAKDDSKSNSAYTEMQDNFAVHQTQKAPNIMHHVSLTVHNLKPGMDYIGYAKVRNKYGWSPESELFAFSTKKGRPMAIQQSSNGHILMHNQLMNLLHIIIIARILEWLYI